MPPELRKSLESAAANILHEDDPHATDSTPAPSHPSDDDAEDACDDPWDDRYDDWEQADDDSDQFTTRQEKNSPRFAPLSQSLPDEFGTKHSRQGAEFPNTSPKVGAPRREKKIEQSTTQQDVANLVKHDNSQGLAPATTSAP
jgi:hypothetical protein